MWNIYMPHTLTLSLRDCLLGGFRVTTNCDHCRMGTSPNLDHLVAAAGLAADRPIIELFDGGKLVCARCVKPWSGIMIERQGPSPTLSNVVVRFWRPGSTCDPAVAAYWEGFRKAKQAG